MALLKRSQKLCHKQESATKIQLKDLQTRYRYILFVFLFSFFGNYTAFSQELPLKKNSRKNMLVKKDSITTVVDTVKIDSVKLPKERLEDIIRDKAKDYKKNDFIKKIATLYNEAELYYKDIELKSGIITIDYTKSLAYAKGILDTTSVYKQRPRFKQGSQESEQDSLIYNFKTQKAVIYNVDTEQEGMLIHANMTKRENDSTIYMNRAEITTSKKKKRDYFIGVNNIKVVPNKKVVGGKSQLYLAGVPTPIVLPFFYVPLTKGRASGLLLPTWGDNSRGYFLQNGGFYFAINDYVDLALTGDIYTNGSWGFRSESSYRKRYRFNGRFALRYENYITGQRGLSNYAKTTNFNILWSHNQDQKASPNSRFSASVNFGSSKFYRNSLNQLDANNFLDNNLSSSISYYQKFVNTPFSMNVALTHTQNTNTQIINMSLPNVNVNMDRIFPFAPKEGAKKNAFQKIALNYGMQLQNNVVTNDQDLFKAGMFDKAKSGIQHNVSLATNLKALKYITITPSATYKEVWYLKTIAKRWNPTTQMIETDTVAGFKSYRTYLGNVRASTTLYGMFNFKNKRLKAIRHKMDISTSYGYTPDFNFYYDVVQKDILGNFEEYSPFDGGVFGSPGRTVSQSVSLNIRNLFEAKVASKDSTETEYKKIRLLNNLDFSTSYNLEADSLKWRPVAMTASTKLVKDLNLNLSASLDPYAIDENGTRYNTFNINAGGGLFRLTNANLVLKYKLSNKTFSKDRKKGDDNKNEDIDADVNQFGRNITNRQQAKKSKKEENTKKVELYHAKIPWNLSLDYNIGYSNINHENEINRNTVRFNGSLELTPKWNINFSSGYDFKLKGLSYTRLGFKRDLDSWNMSFSWTPFGDNASYYFFIGVKAAALSDLKYDQNKIPDKKLF